MNVPPYLKPEGKAFWKKHYNRLMESGLMTVADEESFIQLCEVWSDLRTVDRDAGSPQALRWGSLNKIYLALAKQFGMLPRDRKAAKLEPDQDIQDIINVKMERR